jgi:hypothetical protein
MLSFMEGEVLDHRIFSIVLLFKMLSLILLMRFFRSDKMCGLENWRKEETR